MNVIVCLDDRGGMLFNKRRQSSDDAVCSRVLALTGENRLFTDEYSAPLFTGAQNLCVAENFLDRCGKEDWCFVEKAQVLGDMDRIQKLVIYRWNRIYPRDTVFPTAEFAKRWTLVKQEDFAGKAHERITEEIYTL